MGMSAGGGPGGAAGAAARGMPMCTFSFSPFSAIQTVIVGRLLILFYALFDCRLSSVAHCSLICFWDDLDCWLLTTRSWFNGWNAQYPVVLRWWKAIVRVSVQSEKVSPAATRSPSLSLILLVAFPSFLCRTFQIRLSLFRSPLIPTRIPRSPSRLLARSMNSMQSMRKILHSPY
jgi:hypothetical protein